MPCPLRRNRKDTGRSHRIYQGTTEDTKIKGQASLRFLVVKFEVDSRIFWDYNYLGFTESVKKMDEKVNALLDEVEEKLLHLFEKKLTTIILYGSYARGDYDEESDIDIIALVEDEELRRYDDEIIDFEIDLTIKYGIMPSILIENRDYFTKNKKVEYLFQNVSKYGKTIYAA